MWNPAQTSAGASGALVGIAGAMLATMVRGGNAEPKGSRYSQPLIFFGVICASLLYGFFMPEIDNAAHIGGLAGGFIAGLALQTAPWCREPFENSVFIVDPGCELGGNFCSLFERSKSRLSDRATIKPPRMLSLI